MIVIHHSKDLDGFSSGAVCKRKYPDAEFIGWDYKDPIPDFEKLKDEDVIMIDISFPIEKIQEMLKVVKSLVLIDHHISFFKDYVNAYVTDPGIRDNTESVMSHKMTHDNFTYVYKLGTAACEIGWEYLFPDEKTPLAITLLGRYDTWRQKEGDWTNETLPFQFYMRTECVSVDTFPEFFLENDDDFTGNDYVPEGVMHGNMILKYQRQQDLLNTQRYAFEATVGGYKALCLNTSVFSSDTVSSMFDESKHEIMIGFCFTGNKWIVSLRSVSDAVDVSVLAKSRGGGGHKRAAGFEVDKFEDIFIEEKQELIINAQSFKKLKQLYKVACDNNELSFEFQGKTLVTGYAKYLIEYLEQDKNFIDGK